MSDVCDKKDAILLRADIQCCEKDYSISCVRFIAMIFIVVCHMMQKDNFATNIGGASIEWAFWFNIGVQMFLFISGYLYGKKKSIDIVRFYKKCFSKILIDYYIFILIILIITFFLPLLEIDSDGVVGLLTFSGTINGLGHLWFVPTILFCYLLTPIFFSIINAFDKKSDVRFWIESALLLLIMQIVMMRLFKSFSPVWMNNFVLGMIYSRLEMRGKKNSYLFAVVTFVLCIVIIPVQFRLDYWLHAEFTGTAAVLYDYFCAYGHVFGGIFLTIIIRFFFNKLKKRAHPVLEWSDKYNYDVYLTHPVFVVSALGCVEFISNRWIALPLAVGLTIITAIILYHTSELVRSRFTGRVK